MSSDTAYEVVSLEEVRKILFATLEEVKSQHPSSENAKLIVEISRELIHSFEVRG